MKSRFVTCAAVLLVLVGVSVDAALANQDAQWPLIRRALFGNRTVNPDARGVVELLAPQRAEDASVVPITFRSRMEQTPERYIKHLWLVIDQNPSPFGIKFTLTPESGRADIATRVRLESDSPVRVVAELNDGSLWMDRKMVFGAGGCSAPNGKNDLALRNLGRVRLSVDDAAGVKGEPRLAHLRIIHPQSTGMGAGDTQAPSFIRRVNVYYDNRPVMSADVDFTLSTNPSFRFYFLPGEKGELRAEVEDSDDQITKQSVIVEPDRLGLRQE